MDETPTAASTEASTSAPAPASGVSDDQGMPTPDAPAASPQTGASSEPADDGMGMSPKTSENPTSDVLGSPEGGYSTDGLSLPDGFSLDEGAAHELGAVCKDLNLSQKTFSTLVERMSPVLEQRQAAQRDALGAQFLAAAKADPDIGQAHWTETLADANRAFGMLDKETQQLFTALHLNKHPGVIRAFRNIGRALGDDTVVKGGAASGGDQDPAKRFFYNSKMN